MVDLLTYILDESERQIPRAREILSIILTDSLCLQLVSILVILIAYMELFT